MSFHSTIHYLREYLFPSGCGGCGEALGPADARYGLCNKCRVAFGLALLSRVRCRYCGKPLISERETCLSCRGGRYSGHIKRLFVLFPYTGKFRAVLASYKFMKSTALGVFFARCLVLAVEAFAPGVLEKAVWVPVPSRPEKLKRLGWDQVDYLAKQIGKIKGFAASPAINRCLMRLTSQSQKHLNRAERLENLKGRFRCVKKPPETALLFDDVSTTGATVEICAATLLENGAKEVYAVCLFYG